MSFPKYPEYKNSEITWIGDVPTYWEVKPFKWLLSNNEGGVWGDDPTGEGDTLVLRSTDQTVDGNWKLTDPAPRKLSAKEKASALLVEGDLVVTKSSGSSLHIGKTTLVTADIARQGCCYGNFMQRLRVNSGFTPKLAWYVMNNELARAQLDLLSNSTTGLANLNGTLIGEILLPVSTVAEQTQIARFLDHETARIDALIEEQQRLIELLKEKRQAVISHAVTKGLDPTVPMKDSGVEWLGEVPAHWEANALNKLTVKITNGYVGPTRDILVESGVPYVQATHIKKGVVNFDDAYFVTPEWSMRMSKSILQEGDVLIVQTGAGTGDVGVVSSREVGYNCHALIILQTEKNMLSGVFLGQVLQSRFGQSVLYSIRTGGMHPHLNCGEVKFVKIPVPPLSEQNEISDFVKKFSEQAENLIIEAGTTMDLLQERRSALISAAVTGKIDVRSWQPPATEDAFIEQSREASRESTS